MGPGSRQARSRRLRSCDTTCTWPCYRWTEGLPVPQWLPTHVVTLSRDRARRPWLWAAVPYAAGAARVTGCVLLVTARVCLQEDPMPPFVPPEILALEPLSEPAFEDPPPPVLSEAPRPPAFGAPQFGHDWTGLRPFQARPVCAAVHARLALQTCPKRSRKSPSHWLLSCTAEGHAGQGGLHAGSAVQSDARHLRVAPPALQTAVASRARVGCSGPPGG
jgi:hypothetical protein